MKLSLRAESLKFRLESGMQLLSVRKAMFTHGVPTITVSWVTRNLRSLKLGLNLA